MTEELRRLLGEEASVPSTALGRHLKGPPARALARAVAALLKSGEAVLVVRDGQEHLARPSSDTLTGAEVARVAEAAEGLAALVRAARPRRGKPPRALWRAEVDRCLAGLVGAPRPAAPAVPIARVAPFAPTGAAALGAPPAAPAAAAPAPAPTPADPNDAVVAAARALERPGAPLVFVPELVRALEARGIAAPQRALVAAAIAGRIELRPESGVGLLAADDAARCPRGPTGVPLSYARILDR